MISEPPKNSELRGILGHDFSTEATEQGAQCIHCRFYVPLEWPLGGDYGVCCNPESPAKAQLRFEHMGCLKHEWRHERLRPKEVLHGATCVKAMHDPKRTGYLHGEDDDTPYNVDGCRYCGRCHFAL